MNVFRSLESSNFRLWAAGSVASNIGAWMLFTAQHWLVLVELTHRDAQALAWVLALQSAPQLLLLPWNGYVADRFDRRKVLAAIQAARVLLALLLGVLTLAKVITLWEVYILAFLFGSAAAFDMPARQAFISDLIPEAGLANAVAVNSAITNGARMVGPAVAGLLIVKIGCGGVFLLNALCFAGVLLLLAWMRQERRAPGPEAATPTSQLLVGAQIIVSDPRVRVVLAMLFLLGTFGLNFPLFISTMSVGVFHADAKTFGLMTSVTAAGSVGGALFAAHRARPSVGGLLLTTAFFGLSCGVAASSPTLVFFGVALFAVGASAQVFTTSTSSLVQLATPPHARGRVMAITVAVGLGFGFAGAPLLGWVAVHLGPRWALVVAAASGFGAAGLAAQFLFKRYRLRISLTRRGVALRGAPRRPGPPGSG